VQIIIKKNQYKINLLKCKVVITETLNNLFILITKLKGNIIIKSSIGQICKKANLQLRKTPLSAELSGKYISKKLIEKNFKQYTILISKSFTKIVKNAVKGLTIKKVACKRIRFLENIPHNGVRLKKLKRK
jgi:ribosomal protein S11